MSEHALQVAVARMLQLVLDPERTWWSAIDHGAGKMSKRAGGMMKARGVKRGLPDVMIMPMNEPVLGIELKTDKGRLSPAQVETMTAWTAMGHRIHVARSLNEVQEILDFCRIPMVRRWLTFPEVDYGRSGRAARPRHPRAQRRRKSKGAVPVVLRRSA